MTKGIIFDMDGVIVDSEPLYFEFEYNYFRSLGAEITPEYLLSFVGSSLNNMVNKIFTEYNINSITKEKAMNQIADGARFLYSSNTKLKLCDGIKDWLEFFKHNNYEMVVASSTYSDRVKMCLDRFNLNNYFIGCICGDEVKNSKPDKEIIIKACEKLKLDPSECIVIEDSTNGIKAAKSAGCYCIGYLAMGRNTQNLSEADIIFDKFGEDRINKLQEILCKII